MRRFHGAVLAAFAVFSFASAASAADLPVKAPVYKAPSAVMVTTWTGCYVGGNVGYAWSMKTFYDIEDGFDDGRHTATGWVGGGQIGCDYQFANAWVIGIQGMWDGANVKGSNALPLFPYETWNAKIRSFATVDVRFGYLFNPMTLFYGKAGVAWVNDQFTIVNPNAQFTSSANDTRSGFDLGAGIAWMFAPHWDIFVEYDHIFLPTKDVTFAAYLSGTFPEQIKQSFDKVLVGIDFRFN
jgi:outer membrane immunogenic protein